MADLNPKQQVFVEEYLTCWNATEAARRAEYAHPNKQGPLLLVNVGIKDEIKRRLAEKAMPADEVLARIGDIARGDIRQLMRFEQGKDGQQEFAGLDIGPDKPLHLIKKLKPTRFGMELELHDPYTALALLAKHHGLLQDIDWSKVPEALIKAFAEGLNIADVRRATTESTD